MTAAHALCGSVRREPEKTTDSPRYRATKDGAGGFGGLLVSKAGLDAAIETGMAYSRVEGMNSYTLRASVGLLSILATANWRPGTAGYPISRNAVIVSTGMDYKAVRSHAAQSLALVRQISVGMPYHYGSDTAAASTWSPVREALLPTGHYPSHALAPSNPMWHGKVNEWRLALVLFDVFASKRGEFAKSDVLRWTGWTDRQWDRIDAEFVTRVRRGVYAFNPDVIWVFNEPTEPRVPEHVVTSERSKKLMQSVRAADQTPLTPRPDEPRPADLIDPENERDHAHIRALEQIQRNHAHRLRA